MKLALPKIGQVWEECGHRFKVIKFNNGRNGPWMETKCGFFDLYLNEVYDMMKFSQFKSGK